MMNIRSHTLHLLLLVAAALLVFAASLGNGFVWDDHAFVLGNRIYRDFNVGAMFTSLANGVEYLPLRDLSYGLDYALWGERGAGFHATNLILFLLTLPIIYFLTGGIIRLIDPERGNDQQNVGLASLVAGLIFVLHPLQNQAVNMIICRNVLLSGLCFFSAAACYLRFLASEESSRALWYLASLALFLCALLAKATTIILPLVLLLLLLHSPLRGDRRNLLSLLPFFALAAIFFAIFRSIGLSTNVISSPLQESAATGFPAKMAVALQIPFFYLKKLVIPTGFSAEYDTAFSRSLDDPMVLASLAGLAVLCGLAAYLRGRYPEFLFGLGWFLVTLLPVLNFFATNPVVADRYAYLPVYGFCLTIGVWLSRCRGRSGWLVLIGVAVALIGLGATSFARTAIWKSDKTLWEATIKDSPRLVKAYTNLGWVYYHEGDYPRAFEIFAREQKLAPRSPNLELARGYLHYQRQEWGAAVIELQKALFKKDDFLYALYLLGRSYVNLGDYRAAASAFNRILTSREPDPSGYRETARNNLEWLAAKLGSGKK